MKSSNTKQTKIPFTERKLRPRSKCVTPEKVEDSSEDEISPLKYKLVVRSESKIILRRSSNCRSRSAVCSPERSGEPPRERKTPKRRGDATERDKGDDCCTPTKLKRSDERTPVKGGKDVETPSTVFSRLEIDSAKADKSVSSPRKAGSPRKSLKPKELFPITNASSARKALYTSSDYLPCREEEINRLLNMLEKHMNNRTCGSIYIAGLPGTGKTACIEHVIRNDHISKGYHIVKINCTSISSSVSVYKRICTELKIKTAGKTEKDPKVLIEKYLMRKHKMVLLILDEIDQLKTRSQSVLYKIFEWPSWERAGLVLVGIANAMDLTDRILPRLCAKVELKPLLIHFPPYSKAQISKILSHRLSEVGAAEVFTPSAIELISAKVAGMSGDVRRALDLGRRVVEISEESNRANMQSADKSPQKQIDRKDVNKNLLGDLLKLEEESRASPKKSNLNVESSPVKGRLREDMSNALKEITGNAGEDAGTRDNRRQAVGGDGKIVAPSPNKTRTSPRKAPTFSVDSKDVLSVVKNIYGSSKALKSHYDDSSFPLHQKILICTFLLMSKKGKMKDLNIGKLHSVYTKICTKRGITPVDQSGFLFLCRQVEMAGVMQIGKGQGKLARINLLWDESEVADALKDLNLLSSILNDVSCL